MLNQCGYQQDVLTSKAALIRKVVDETGCHVVVSSTWRLFEDRRELLGSLLGDAGVSILDWTPEIETMDDHGFKGFVERGEEIQLWLDANPEVSRFVILDDFEDMAHLGAQLVKTESSIGLTEALAEEVILRLNLD